MSADNTHKYAIMLAWHLFIGTSGEHDQAFPKELWPRLEYPDEKERWLDIWEFVRVFFMLTYREYCFRCYQKLFFVVTKYFFLYLPKKFSFMTLDSALGIDRTNVGWNRIFQNNKYATRWSRQAGSTFYDDICNKNIPYGKHYAANERKKAKVGINLHIEDVITSGRKTLWGPELVMLSEYYYHLFLFCYDKKNFVATKNNFSFLLKIIFRSYQKYRSIEALNLWYIL